jgi:hypothetical protein
MPENYDNEWYRAAFVKAHFEDSQTIVQVYTEPLSDYLSPDPIRSYNIKLRINSTSKGLPHAHIDGHSQPYDINFDKFCIEN